MGDDDEQYYERFNVDNDFEEGTWIGGEFFHKGRKQKRQQNADDRLYGVFADGSDSDDDRKRKRRGGDRGEDADYSMPVGFVSSGVVNKPPEDSAPEGAYDVQGPPGGQEGTAGLGAGSGGGRPGLGSGGGGGLGFRSAGKADVPDEEDEGEDGVLSTALGARCDGHMETLLCCA